MAVIGEDEAVEIEVEAVLHRGAVDLGDEPARLGQGGAVDADAIADGDELLGRLARMPPAPAADMEAELAATAGPRPRFNAPMTLVVMPEECQSIPMTAPKDWNQKGCARRRRNSSRP